MGEKLDAHRKARQAEHPDLTLTGMDNVLEKLRKDEAPAPVVAEKLPWPKSTVERVATLKQLLQTLPPDPVVLSPALKGSNTQRRRDEIQDLLDTLASLGQLA